MLLIDGVKYELWIPSVEDELEQMVKEHAQDIFGEQSEYFAKQRLESKLGKGSIPDGFVIIFNESPCWHIVEVELSSHDLHRHIVEQASRFIIGIKNPQSQRKIVEAIYEEINIDDLRRLRIKRAIETSEIHRFLTDLISKTPILTIIIEKHTEELDEALSALAHPQIKVVEFQTFVREDVGLSVHSHLFQPIYGTIIKPVVVKDKPAVTGQDRLDVTIKNPTCINYHLLFIPRQSRSFFPGYKVPFYLITDAGEIETHVSSAPAGTRIGDPNAGVYIQANLAEWYKKYSDIKVGDKVVFEIIEPMKRYRLSKA